MHFELLANATFVAHGLFVLLAIPSTYLLVTGFYRSFPTLGLLHHLSIAVMVAGQLRFNQCPLVELEAAFRHRAGTEMWYEGGYVRFVTNELTGVMLPAGSVGMISGLIALATIAALIRHLAGTTSESDPSLRHA